MRQVNTFLTGSSARYRVIIQVAVCELINGNQKYVYLGGLLPADASPAHIEHLLSVNAVEKVGA